MVEEKRYIELDYFNAICCLLVILIHVLSLGISSLARDSWQAAIVFFPWKISAFVVPAFLFSGAVKIATSLDESWSVKKYWKYIRRRISKIYIPYVLWHTIYYFVFLKIGFASGTAKEYFNSLFWGTLSSPFYYIVIVMQFYILYPVWRYCVKKLPGYIPILASILLTFVSMESNQFLHEILPGFEFSDRLFTTYLIFWISGLYIGKYYDQFKIVLLSSKKNIVIASISVSAFILTSYFQYATSNYFFSMSYLKIFSDLLSICVLLYICLNLVQKNGLFTYTLKFVSNASFFVYLSHSLFLTLITYFLQRNGIDRISILLLWRFMITYSTPFLLYLIWKKVKGNMLRLFK